MTISSIIRKAGPYIGNDVTTVFPFSFKVFTSADLYVVRLDVDTGVETQLALSTNYSVSLNADQNANPGGTITLISALADGYTLTISSNISALQATDLTNQGGFYPAVITNALDKLTILIQQLLEAASRSLRLPISTSSSVSAELPAPEASKLIGWNVDADGLENYDSSTLATLVAYGTANADIFDGDGTTTVFVLSANPAVLNNLDVSISGVTQTPGVDYTWTSGTNITFTTAPPAGTDNVLVRYMQGLAAPDTAIRAELLASTGAGIVGTEDDGEYLAGDTVEENIQELGNAVDKNLLVNGPCLVGRTADAVALTTTAAIGAVDGWYVFQNTAANGISAHVASTVAGLPRALKIGRTAASASTNSILTIQALGTPESLTIAGSEIEFSFYAKAGANFSGANINVGVFSGTGTDESAASIGTWTGVASVVATTQVITTSWVKYTFSGTVASNATQVGVRIFYTPVGTAGADDNLFLTGLKLRQKAPTDRRLYADELILTRPRIPTCGRLSNLIDAAGPLGPIDPFIKAHFIPYNGNQIIINGRVEIIPDGQLAASGGLIVDYRNCYIDKVAGQVAADNTFYFAYAFMLNGRTPTITLSTTGYSQNGVLFGNAVKSDDPSCTLLGILYIQYVSGVPTTYGSARGQTISSYFNQFRASLVTAVAGPVTSATQVQLPDGGTLANGEPTNNFLEWVQWYDQAPRTKLAANVGVNSAGATANLGIGLNSRVAISGFTAKSVVPSTADNTQHLTVLSAPTDNTGYYYAQVLGYSSAGTLQADGYLLADGVMV